MVSDETAYRKYLAGDEAAAQLWWSGMATR